MHQHGGAKNLHPMKQAQSETYQIRKVARKACLSMEGEQAEHCGGGMDLNKLALDSTSTRVLGRRAKIRSPDSVRETSNSTVTILTVGTA